MITFRKFVDFFYGRYRLESIKMLPLGSSVSHAIELYGEPIESKPSDDSPEITELTFAAGDYHEVVTYEWQGQIQSITYWSMKSAPSRDLSCVLNAYRGASGWQVMEEGYWYRRNDGLIKLWCSAIPAIGVAFDDFLRVKAELKTAHSLSKIADLPDVTWVPDDVVFELQRMFVEDGNQALMEFAQRSDSIAVSPDGRNVFIVRNHHAYDVEGGFMELNGPPEPGNGYAVEVINCFYRTPDSSGWGKTTLPRDAKVDRISFTGERCLLEIHQIDGERKLKFEGLPSEIRGLGCHIAPYTDNDLWKALEDAEAEQSSGGAK